MSKSHDEYRVMVIAGVFAVAILIVMFLVHFAYARDGTRWYNTDTAISTWFKTLMQPDYPTVSCCGDSDAYEADEFEIEGDHYVAIITAHRAVTSIAVGTRIPVPNHKMKWDAGNPTGHGIIFIGQGGQVYCYVTPGGI